MSSIVTNFNLPASLPRLPEWASTPAAALLALIPVAVLLRRVLKKPARPSKIAKDYERVLILGASTGIGRSIAHLYSERGARVCIVGRREAKIHEVVGECRSMRAQSLFDDMKVIGVAADFSNVEDMVRLRERLEKEWQGVDTIIVAAGVSALRPLMSVAGVEAEQGSSRTSIDATAEGIQHAVDISQAALKGNFTGPLIAAVTFIPLLIRTSASPSILHVSSVGAVIPAPTRSLYGSTKSAALLLYQALSIEHSQISFTNVLPFTVEGDFRASAVDGGAPRELDPNKHGLKREVVAKRCVDAVDKQEKTVFIPGTLRVVQMIFWMWPSYVENMARRKYNF